MIPLGMLSLTCSTQVRGHTPHTRFTPSGDVSAWSRRLAMLQQQQTEAKNVFVAKLFDSLFPLTSYSGDGV